MRRVLPILGGLLLLLPAASAGHFAPIAGSGTLSCSLILKAVVQVSDCNTVQQTHGFPASPGTYRLTVNWAPTNPAFTQLQAQLLVVRCAGGPVCVGGGSASSIVVPGQMLTVTTTENVDTAFVTLQASAPGLLMVYTPTGPQPLSWTLSH